MESLRRDKLLKKENERKVKPQIIGRLKVESHLS